MEEVPPGIRNFVTRLKIEGKLNKADIYNTGLNKKCNISGFRRWHHRYYSGKSIQKLTTPSVLKYIVLPQALKGIGAEAFYGCEDLDSVIIPSSVKAIRDNAFMNCTSLVKVESKIVDPLYCYQSSPR